MDSSRVDRITRVFGERRARRAVAQEVAPAAPDQPGRKPASLFVQSFRAGAITPNERKRGNVAVVQKLLRVHLDPKHTDQLPDLLQELPISTELALFSAAACDGFQRRHDRRFVPSLSVMETVLQQRGALDADGHPS